MTTIAAYFDGKSVQTLEEAPMKRNQRLLITVLDEFLDNGAGVKSLRGGLSRYANAELRSQESSAWASAVEEKHAVR